MKRNLHSPRAWKVAALGDVCEIVSGATPKTSEPDFWCGDIPWATPKDLSSLKGHYIGSTPRMLSHAGLGSCAARMLPAGSVLLSSRAPIGHVAINTVPMATNQGFKSLVPSESIDAKFLFWWLRCNTDRLQSLGSGATFKEISKRVTARIEIPLPPIEEQRRIAAILDAADALRAKRRQALAKLDTLTQAIFIDMFGGDWEQFQFVDVAALAMEAKGSIRTGPFGSQLLHEEFVDSGVAVLGIDNAVHNTFAWGKRRFITEEKYEHLKRFTVRPGDVLVTIMGTCGRVAVVPQDIPTSINTKHLCCITLNPELCLPEWLQAALLFHPRVLRQLGATHGAVMPGLNMGLIKGAEIPLPTLALQRQFVSQSASVLSQMTDTDSSMKSLDDLFASLQQRAFRGDL